MQDKRLGCLTRMGIIAALLISLIIAGFAYTGNGALFSPGALNGQPGRNIGGVTSHAHIPACSGCHVNPLGTQFMADRCLDCHSNIAVQMRDVAALHGAILNVNATLVCRDCHHEHRGKAAALTDLGHNSFPHDALGYSLQGHRLTAERVEFTCTDCHPGDVATFSPSICQDCHRRLDAVFMDRHLADFGTQCLACHDGVDRLGIEFSHASFSFTLQGMHQQVSCAACHAGARTLVDLQSTPQDCLSCHHQDDPHQGKYGQDCAACHSAKGWLPAEFDHNLADFKLEGQHQEVPCQRCHVNGVYKGTPTDCYSCHRQDDEHNGDFGTKCSSCHTPQNWDQATFDHNLSKFPLTGAHVAVRCETCHQNGVFKGLASTCASCHADPEFHLGLFGTLCEDCHNTSNWSLAVFNLPHPEPNVDEGGTGINHGGATCRQCHPATFQQSSCIACHENGFEDGEGEEHEGGDND